MEIWHPGLIIPLGAFAMVVLIVAVKTMGRVREKELQAHQDLRAREMEHERQMKALEVEQARLELEKNKMSKSS